MLEIAGIKKIELMSRHVDLEQIATDRAKSFLETVAQSPDENACWSVLLDRKPYDEFLDMVKYVYSNSHDSGHFAEGCGLELAKNKVRRELEIALMAWKAAFQLAVDRALLLKHGHAGDLHSKFYAEFITALAHIEDQRASVCADMSTLLDKREEPKLRDSMQSEFVTFETPIRERMQSMTTVWHIHFDGIDDRSRLSKVEGLFRAAIENLDVEDDSEPATDEHSLSASSGTDSTIDRNSFAKVVSIDSTAVISHGEGELRTLADADARRRISEEEAARHRHEAETAGVDKAQVRSEESADSSESDTEDYADILAGFERDVQLAEASAGDLLRELRSKPKQSSMSQHAASLDGSSKSTRRKQSLKKRSALRKDNSVLQPTKTVEETFSVPLDPLVSGSIASEDSVRPLDTKLSPTSTDRLSSSTSLDDNLGCCRSTAFHC